MFLSGVSVWYQKTRTDTDEDLEACVTFDDLREDEKIDRARENEDFLACYCQQFTWISVYRYADDGLRDACVGFLRKKLISSVLQALVSATATIAAVGFNFSIKFMGTYERVVSQDEVAWRVFVRLFTLKSVTLGVVVMAVHSDTFVNTIMPSSMQYETQAYFDTAWFLESGAQVILSMLFSAFAQHGVLIIRYLRRQEKYQRVLEGSFAEAGVYTQEHLNATLLGGNFYFYERYAEILSFFSVCFAYGAGMPILYVIGAVGCALFFLVDKFLFSKFYRIPPRYSDRIGSAVIEFLPVLLCIHLLLSMWMLGAGPIFQNDTTREVSQMAVRRPALFTMFIIVTSYVFFKYLGGEILSFLKFVVDLVPCLCCLRSCFSSEFASETVVTTTYEHAKVRNQLQGLHGYHVLQNPVYREAFGLGSKGAASREDSRSGPTSGSLGLLDGGSRNLEHVIERDLDRDDEDVEEAMRNNADPEEDGAADDRAFQPPLLSRMAGTMDVDLALASHEQRLRQERAIFRAPEIRYHRRGSDRRALSATRVAGSRRGDFGVGDDPDSPSEREQGVGQAPSVGFDFPSPTASPLQRVMEVDDDDASSVPNSDVDGRIRSQASDMASPIVQVTIVRSEPLRVRLKRRREAGGDAEDTAFYVVAFERDEAGRSGPLEASGVVGVGDRFLAIGHTSVLNMDMSQLVHVLTKAAYPCELYFEKMD